MLGTTRSANSAHMQNFLDCMRTGQETNCPFDLGFRVSIACSMAVESYPAGTHGALGSHPRGDRLICREELSAVSRRFYDF